MLTEKLANIVPKCAEELGWGHHGAHQGPGIAFISRAGSGGCTDSLKASRGRAWDCGLWPQGGGLPGVDAFRHGFIIWRPGLERPQVKSMQGQG